MSYKLLNILSITYISHSPRRKQMTYSKGIIEEKNYLENTGISERNHQLLCSASGLVIVGGNKP